MRYLALSIIVLLTACMEQYPATVEFHGDKFYGFGESSYLQFPPDHALAEASDMVVVKARQSLKQIASEHQVSVHDLVLLNHLRYPYKIHEGQRLYLPDHRVHKVRHNETVRSIARDHNISLNNLLEFNHLTKDSHVKPGQELFIPSGKKTTILQHPDMRVSEDLDKETYESVPTPVIKQQQLLKDTQITSEAKPVEQSTPMKTINILRNPGRFAWPVNQGKIISHFGPQKSGYRNDGINILAPENTPVKAASDGIVIYAGNELKGYGNLTIIKHKSGWLTAYAHQKDMVVSKGATVKQGETIGHVGATGNVTQPQLHFGIRQGKRPFDPEKYLD